MSNHVFIDPPKILLLIDLVDNCFPDNVVIQKVVYSLLDFGHVFADGAVWQGNGKVGDFGLDAAYFASD